MKVLKRKGLLKTKEVESVVEEKPRKSTKGNKLPPDEYRDEIPPKEIVLDDNGKLYPLWDIMKAFIHELIHCRQWHDPDFKRLRGIMHNPEFYKLYSDYISRAKARQLFKEVQNSESVY